MRLPLTQNCPKYCSARDTHFDLPQWITSHNLSIASEGPWHHGGYKWVLNPCPWNESHTDRAAFIVRFANGAIGAGCHHNSCHGKDWYTFRGLLDPEWDGQQRDRPGEHITSHRRYTQHPILDPTPLVVPIADPLPFPLEAFKNPVPLLYGAISSIHRITQAPLALCAQSVLAAVTLAVQGHGDLLLPGHTVAQPISEYFATIAESGERKTTADSMALSPVYAVQDKWHKEYIVEKRRYENQHLAWKKARAETEKAVAGRAEKEKALEEVGDEPEALLEPLMLVSEPTIPGLVKALIRGQPSMGIFSDEGAIFLGGHAMSADHRNHTAGSCHAFGMVVVWIV